MWTQSRFGVVVLYSPQIHELKEMDGHCKKVPCDVDNAHASANCITFLDLQTNGAPLLSSTLGNIFGM
jgi:hypothetical protein